MRSLCTLGRRLGALWVLVSLGACTSTGLLRLASSADLINPAVRVQHDVAYGSAPRQRLDVYRPRADSAAERPLIVFVHGGSWYWGSKNLYRFVGAGLAERGAVVAVINYRLHPEAHLADSVQDVAMAVAQLQRDAAQVGADPRRIYLMGHSAGAELAALVALDPSHLRALGAAPVQGFIGLAGPYDFLPITDDYLKEYFGPPERYPDSQPVNAVSRASAPSLLLQGLADTTVLPRNTEALANRLRSAGVPVETLVLEHDDHSTILRRLARPYRHDDPVVARIEQFVGATP
jgi:acetyl esterase/lipase